MTKLSLGCCTAALLLTATLVNAQQYTITDSKGNSATISQQQAEAIKTEMERRRAEETAKQNRARQVITDGQTAPKPEVVAYPDGSTPTGPTVDNRRKPENVLQWLENNNWQKFAEIRNGNVIMLRRSTDVPPAPGETVVFRWQTPTEFAKKEYLSSRPGHLPNRPLGPQLENRIKEGTEFGD